MKSIYLYLVGILVVCALAIPLVVKNQVSSQIQTKQKALLTNGVELKILKEEGYISSLRDYELKIVDGEKFRDYVLAQLVLKNPYYKYLSNFIKEKSNKDIRLALDGTTFKGTITNSNILSKDPLIELALVKLSDEFMKNIDKDKEIADIIKLMLDEKMITFFVTLDSNQNLSKAVMKDIDKTINKNGDDINFKFVGHKLELDIADTLKGIYNLDTQSFTTKEFSMENKGISYSFDYLSQFENKASFHVDNLEIKNKKSIFKIGNIDAKNTVKEVKNSTISGNINYSIQDLYFSEFDMLKIDSYTLDFDLSKIDKNALVAMYDLYNKVIFNNLELTDDEEKAFDDSIKNILNKGFNFNIKSSLSGLTLKDKTVQQLDLILNAKLKPNTHTISDFKIINALVMNGSISLYEKDIEEIVKLDKSLKRFVKLGKKEADKLIFNYELKEGTFYLNGKKL